jgi:oxygen-independent coproporphyrinogen-3 oxidase
MSGLYLHIPFCKQACSYCDFYFATRQHQQQEFVDALVDEIQSKKETKFAQEIVQTIYLGGGTPSLLKPGQLEQIFEALDATFELDIQECTMELNPDDVTKDYLQSLKVLGINRASMGIQSFDEDLLKFMHRAHNRSEALQSLELLASEGFDSFTVDLIYGNPNQTDEMLRKDLEILASFNPPHVSAYSLTIEEGTRLGKQVDLGRITPPDDEKVAKQFQLVQSKLEENGILQYEVSNFARLGWEAKHNSAYWSHQNYLGFGPAAHSFWWSNNAQTAERWNNKRDLKAYLSEEWKTRNELEELNMHALAEERLMLGLRMKIGVSLKELKERYQYSLSENQMNYLRKKEDESLLKIEGDNLALTKSGLLIADLLILDLITA